LILGNPGTPFLLDLQLYDGFAGAFVLANVRSSSGTIFMQAPLSHVGKGLYTYAATIASIGSYTVQYVVYSDAGFTSEDLKYIVSEEQIKIQAPVSSQSSVDAISVQITNLASELETLVGSIEIQLENSSINMTTGVITATKTQEILAWLEVNGVIIMDPVSCSITLKDGSGFVVYNFGLNATPLANGFFRFTQPNADVSLGKGQTYLAVIDITHGSKTYSAIRSLTVLF
jgi:hypothetical protein